MSYLAYELAVPELLPYWQAMQSAGSNGSVAVLVRQQRMTLLTISQQWMLWWVTKNQMSMTVLLTLALVWLELEQSVHSRSHRAMER